MEFDYKQEYSKAENEFIKTAEKYDVYVLIYGQEYPDALSKINSIPETSAIIVQDTIVLIYTKTSRLREVSKYLKSISVTQMESIYTLMGSPVEESKAYVLHNKPYLYLRGKGVLVGVIDTGIDYLNKEFQYEDGSTRIVRILDQTIQGDKPIYDLKLGTEFNDKEINEAIAANQRGEDPYKIVPSKDELGHGTAMAGIIGARGAQSYDNQNITGAAPGCEFIVAKLKPASKLKLDLAGVKRNVADAYSPEYILAALRYIVRVSEELKRPIVIYLPLGTCIANREGQNMLELYMDYLVGRKGTIIVTGAGNQGMDENHAQGRIEKSGANATLELKVDNDQGDLFFNIHYKVPDRYSLIIVSPSGQVVQESNPKSLEKEIKFIYEGTRIQVFFEEPRSTIKIKCYNIVEGIWKFVLVGNDIIDGRYWAYLPQRKLLAPGTKILNSSTESTITVPNKSASLMVCSYYNQSNESIVAISGKGYTIFGDIVPQVTAAGINALVLKPGGGTSVFSGASVAAAVLAGALALIFEWAIVKENIPGIYAYDIKTLVIQGARRPISYKFPNIDWGYGILDIEGIFNSLRSLGDTNMENRNIIDEPCIEYKLEKTYIRIPKTIFNFE